jgi:murein DD-endopeptidase MepM/ murein hydrolase activator NlpD
MGSQHIRLSREGNLMPTSAPVALGLGGVAAILLVSGVQGKGISDIMKGDFGKPPDPKGEGGPSFSGVSTSGAGPNVEGAPAGLISPFPKSSKVTWGRSDQGIDGTVQPGSPLIAMGNGTVEIHHDPSGFGSNYLILHVDGDGAFYYGHCVPAVASGARVRKGQVIARANINGQGNATTPGSFEIGKWPPGSISSAGAQLRKWFTSLPRI